MPNSETKRALIVVRTYPVPAKQGAEVSCTAALTDKGEWLRLFPVPWRLLAEDQKFRKYQWVDVEVVKASDTRPESYKLRPDGITIVSPKLSTRHGWRERKEIILKQRAHCLCCLVRERNANGHPTLGIFRPRSISKLAISEENPNWTESQLAILRQGHLFIASPPEELEKIPYAFRYEFQCDDDDCTGHKIICTDWEMGESYRKWRNDYGDGWEAKFRQRFETEMIHKNDTHFIMGTVHGHPQTWIIVGLFYPPKEVESAQSELF